jgi:alginate O-acetyltransferase complex protein AlgI
LPGGTVFVLFVFVFSGYWHGAAWGYIIWALAHFCYFIFFPRRFMRRLPTQVAVLSNFIIVSLLWLPFALGGDGLLRWGHGVWGALQVDRLATAANIGWAPIELTALGIAIVLLAPNGFQMMRSSALWPIKRAAAAILIVISLHKIFSATGTPPPFVYFQF